MGDRLSESPRPLSLRRVAGRVGRQSIAYTLAAAVGPITGILLLPVYTRYLTPSDYGLIALFEVLSLVLSAVFSLGMPAMIPFYYVDVPDAAARRRGVGSVVVAITILNVILALVLSLAGQPLVALLLPTVPFWPYVPILAATAIFDPYWTAIGAILQIQERAFTFSAWSITRLVVAIVMKVIFVVVLLQGVYGFLVSNLITSLVTAAIVAPMLWREMDIALDAAEIRRAFVLGGPTVPNNLFTYGFRVLDRVLMERFVDRGQIGLYFLALKLGDLIKLCADVFLNAWRPVFFKEAGEPWFRAVTAPTVIRLVSVGVIGVCVAIALFSREIITLLAAPAYVGAARFVPLIVGAMALKAIYSFPYLAVWYRKRTGWLPVLTVVTMGFSIAANLILIPRLGAMGAAVVFFASYVLLLVLMTVLAQRSFRMNYSWTPLCAAFFAGTAITLIGAPLEPGLMTFAMKVALLAIYAVVVVITGGIRLRDLGGLGSKGHLVPGPAGGLQ
jgi:O-antigen/teichoic acid export membrane protein